MTLTTPSPQDVTCNQVPDCTNRVLARDTQAATDERARAGGWRVWDGPTTDGPSKRFAVCPEHARIPRPRKPIVQEFDEPLW